MDRQSVRHTVSRVAVVGVALVLLVGTGCGGSPLVRSIRDRDQAGAIALIDGGADVRQRDAKQYAPLHYAAQQGETDVARKLLDHGAQRNPRGTDGRTPLMLACAGRRDTSGVIDLLLSRGANPNGVDGRGQTALHYAVLYDRAADVVALLAHGADPNVADDRGEYPLHRAVSRDHFACAAALLDGRANPNVRAADDATPLQLAEAKGASPMVALIRSHGGHE